ncbi:uncharacterized protein LOC124736037 [Schistocerca piceifrons]|uniref:uncharacterized protein LOC124736037 n=1 Tax=Schistocerca piceifrons TaxID=274613 RepID=UPI001F5F3B0E|nr:uncharacterized protein LOC124736037 [Schistocerca piceifrons]
MLLSFQILFCFFKPVLNFSGYYILFTVHCPAILLLLPDNKKIDWTRISCQYRRNLDNMELFTLNLQYNDTLVSHRSQQPLGCLSGHLLQLSLSGKITEGVTFQRILDDVRDSVHSSGMTRQDLHNIKRDFDIGDDQQHNIEVSVSMWLEKMKDCVLLYKKEGEAREDFDSTDSVIVLMTDYQKQLLQRFGQNIVCVYSTHCTNVYKLLVTTLLVVDDFGSGMPVAFCVSNRETTSIMTHFFSAVKERAS